MTTDHPTRQVDRPRLQIGDRVRLHPHNGGTRWWTVRALDDRYLVATRRAAFSTGTEDTDGPAIAYTVVDWTGWSRRAYNGAGYGPVRSSLNTLGGGYYLDPDRLELSAGNILRDLHAGTFELSHRRIVDLDRIEVEAR